MNILEKIFDKLHISDLFNRKNSPSIKAGGNITAGGDIVIGGTNPPKAAVLNKGKRNTYINTTMVGPDHGMVDEGEDTTVIDSDIRSIGNKK